jgi:hypothetical protein
MQLLKLVIFNVSIKLCAAHGIGIILIRDGAVISCARVLRRYHTFAYDASMVGCRTVIVHVISGKTPAANLP